MEKRPNILLVDDMSANISLLSELLKQDYRLRIAKSGTKALEIANAADKPDLILLDIEMPEMDGYEVCRRLKNNEATKDIPIIFVTARDDVVDEALGLNLGAVDYITKPFHSEIIKIRIRNHIALKLKSDCLESLARIDGLTHIPNRRYFNDLLGRAFQRSLEDKTVFALMMMDVDFFKPYNDNYGHGRGDDCLIKVAARLDRVVQSFSGFLARYGGEEFVVILNSADEEKMHKLADALLVGIRQLMIEHEYSAVSDHVTISIGAVLVRATQTSSPELLLKQADDALYQAKRAGRDRAVFVE